jgi:hypothetical protein
MSSFNITSCQCTTQQYKAIIFDSVGYQNSANTVYQSKNAQVVAATAGTLGKNATGNTIFKSNYERMQYLLGKQNQGNSGAGCGVPAKAFILGTN